MAEDLFTSKGYYVQIDNGEIDLVDPPQSTCAITYTRGTGAQWLSPSIGMSSLFVCRAQPSLDLCMFLFNFVSKAWGAVWAWANSEYKRDVDRRIW